LDVPSIAAGAGEYYFLYLRDEMAIAAAIKFCASRSSLHCGPQDANIGDDNGARLGIAGCPWLFCAPSSRLDVLTPTVA
jgi:hypothetical protein